MLRFPSLPAAILTGTLWMPLFIWGVKFIERNVDSQLLLFLWSFTGFILPTLVSTADLRYICDRMRAEGTLFGKLRAMLIRPEDYRLLFIPAWTRMAALFLSTVVSVVFLRIIGINL